MIVVKKNLDQDLYEAIKSLEKACEEGLKLELDYKMNARSNENREYMYYESHKLIGYLGVSHFGSGMKEVNGMVHPDYRNKGIFTSLYKHMIEEHHDALLLLADRQAKYGQYIVKKYGLYDHTEYEMYHEGQRSFETTIKLLKANNSHAEEIMSQNELYFGKRKDAVMIYPEQEAEKGIIIYLAFKDENLIGKVHLVKENGLGAIYGLGVYPKYRGLGYGRSILEESIKKLRDCDEIMLQVESKNDKALNLYEKAGFKTRFTMDYYIKSPSNHDENII